MTTGTATVEVDECGCVRVYSPALPVGALVVPCADCAEREAASDD